MRNLISRLDRGINHFGSGGYNTENFNTFFNDFKKSFTNQLRKLKATKIVFSKGHFYLSGFFTVNEQAYYFSLSDVRWGERYGEHKLLVRTAKDYSDYTGGANRYVEIENGMYKAIAKTFNLEVVESTKTTKKDINYYVNKAITENCLDLVVPSGKMANRIAWGVAEKLNLPSQSINVYRYGRHKSSAKMHTDLFSYNYCYGSKKINISFVEESNEQFENRVKKRYDVSILKGGAKRTNPFSGESIELDGFAKVLHDYVKECESSGKFTEMQKGLSLFAEKYPNEYMVLLD